MRAVFLVALICVVFLAPTSPGSAGDMKAQTAFDELKSLAGTWRGTPEAEGMEAEAEAEMIEEVVLDFRVSAAGTVVMETMGPGTEHEMINMYHLDGEDLVLTHYCAGGNQPTMKLDREMSTPGKLVFDFTGGTNLDPEVDQHIHSAELELRDPEHLESVWAAYAGGKQVSTMTFHVARSD
jgi:hypothetical protein